MPDLLTLEAPTDSALLWALVRRRLGGRRSRRRMSCRSVVLDVEAAAPGSRLNLLLVDPYRARGIDRRPRALRTGGSGAAVVVSSEPLDDRSGLDRPCPTDSSSSRPPTTSTSIPSKDEVTMLDSSLKPTIDVRLTPDAAADALRADALRGLTADPKWLPPKWFYDARGSELFEAHHHAARSTTPPVPSARSSTPTPRTSPAVPTPGRWSSSARAAR